MATTRVARLRLAAAIVIAAVLAWVIYETIYAGSEIPPQAAQQQTQLSGGSANGKRIDGKSWSLDYDTASLSQDGSIATIENVHDGIIMRDGKPYMHMTAQHVSANLTLNDFTVTGKVTFSEVVGEHRRLETMGAHYAGADHSLRLDHPTTIRDGPITLHVATASVNFATGEMKLGRITGNL